MRKLAEVEQAKALMTEAMAWSVMKWLAEKKRVRKTADKANAALDQLNQEVKACWSEPVKSAYDEVMAQAGGTPPGRRLQQGKQQPHEIPRQLLLLAKKIKEADEEAYRARMDAENTFDEAERQLSTSLAREGCRKAIQSWDLHEKAIRKAEGIIGSITAI